MEHTLAAQGRWRELSLVEQMGNIGSEIIRTINWKKKKNDPYAALAFDRALELFDLTLADEKNRHRLKEIARAREFVGDYFVGDNVYASSDDMWEKYFMAFTYAARLS